ncbi:MAG: potassium channel protein [Terrimicrobiaceae bacterium]
MLKTLPAQITTITASIHHGVTHRNLRFLGWFAIFLVLLVVIYTVIFHKIMDLEGQDHSWLSGLYWTLVTMSTLGFGDITFQSDLGRLFSVLVLVSGMLLLLVLLPFSFIEFFYSPFVKAQQEARAPRSVSSALKDHVILTNYDAVTALLARRLENARIPYCLVVADVQAGLRLHDLGVRVVVADLNDPAAFANCGFDRAVMVAATGSDFENTSIAFTAREISKSLTILATASSADSVDVMQLAGASRVLQLGEQLGQALGRRTVAADAQAHVIGSFDRLQVAEAVVAGTPLKGKTLSDTRLREMVGVNVIGLWQRGVFVDPNPGHCLTDDTILILAGSSEQIGTYNELFCIYHRVSAPCLIIGGGRVGRAAAAFFAQSDIDYRVIDSDPSRIRNPEKYVLGSAADLGTLERGGIQNAPAVLITTRQDDVNIYLTIYCRKLRPDIQILARANLEANVSRLHSAGADVVMSYAAMGSNAIFNLLRNDKTLLVAEGLNVFRSEVPARLVGTTIRKSEIRSRTGCSVVAIEVDGELTLNPDPDEVLRHGREILLIGTLAAEEKFLSTFGA